MPERTARGKSRRKDPRTGRSRRPRRGPFWRSWWMLGLFVAALVALGAAYRVARVATNLDATRDRLEAAAELLKQGQPAAARREIAIAQTKITDANNQLHGRPEVSLFSLVPVFRQNISGLRSAVSVALRMTAGGQRLLEASQPLENAEGKFEVPMRTGAVPLPVLRNVGPELDELAANLPLERDKPRSTFMLGPVNDLIDSVYRQSGIRQAQTSVLARGVELLIELSGGNGPRRVLIAVANAAEMRGTGGMVLAYGQLTSDNGKFSLDKFGGIDELQLTAKADTPPGTPADYLTRFADLEPTLFWRNTNLGGDFTYIGPIFESMFRKSAEGRQASGVLQIDSLGLAAILKAIGPVEVAGLGQVTDANVVAVTLSEAYNRFPNERTARQEVLGDVAEAVFKKLVTGDYPSLRPLATSLVDAVAERRLLLHMADGSAQRSATALGVDGRLPGVGPDLAMLTVQNFGGNKLDYYLDTAVGLTGQRQPGALGKVRATVKIKNAAPVGRTAPAYVFGPFNRALKAGQYVGLASLYLPKGASLRTANGDLQEGPATLSTEAERSVVSFPVRVDAGGEINVTLDLELPPGPGKGYSMVLMPVSRVRPTTFAVDLDRGGGRGHLRYSGPLLRPASIID